MLSCVKDVSPEIPGRILSRNEEPPEMTTSHSRRRRPIAVIQKPSTKHYISYMFVVVVLTVFQPAFVGSAPQSSLWPFIDRGDYAGMGGLGGRSGFIRPSQFSQFRFRFAARPQTKNALLRIKKENEDREELSKLVREEQEESAASSQPLGPSSIVTSAIPRRETRDYVSLRCRGVHDPGILARLNRICEDCYNLYKDPEVHQFCRSDCFSTDTFRQCLQSLLLEKESDSFMEMVDIVGKKR